MSGPLIKIFSQLYVGFNKRRHREDDGTWKDFKLAFVTPYEDNQAGRKRQATVDSWASTSGEYTWEVDPETGRREQKFKPLPDDYKTVTIDNVPMEGFRLTEDIRRTYWGGGNVVWRIESPLGWEFEISSSCLARLITDVGFEPGGIIPGKCIFGRCGAENILIPEASELYQQSIKDAETITKRSKSVSTNKVFPGSICLMKTGDKMTYLGQFYLSTLLGDYDNVTSDYWGSTTDVIAERNRKWTPTKSGDVERFHVFRRVNDAAKDETGNHAIMYKEKSVVEVLGIDDKFEGLDENESFLNNSGITPQFANASRHTYYMKSIVFTNEKPVSTSFAELPITAETLRNEMEIVQYHGTSGHFLFKNPESLKPYLVIDADGFSLSSMQLAGISKKEPYKNEQGFNQVQFERDSIKVFFASRYKIEGGVLSSGLIESRRYSCTIGFTNYQYVQRHNHFEANEIITQAFNEALEKFQYRVIKFSVSTANDTIYQEIK